MCTYLSPLNSRSLQVLGHKHGHILEEAPGSTFWFPLFGPAKMGFLQHQSADQIGKQSNLQVLGSENNWNPQFQLYCLLTHHCNWRASWKKVMQVTKKLALESEFLYIHTSPNGIQAAWHVRNVVLCSTYLFCDLKACIQQMSLWHLLKIQQARELTQ